MGRRQAGQAMKRQAGQAKRQAGGRDNGRRQAMRGSTAGRQAAALRGAGKTGRFCNAFGRQNGPKTDTGRMRTRVNPVILYAHPVILGVKKSISQLRISEKKILK